MINATFSEVFFSNGHIDLRGLLSTHDAVHLRNCVKSAVESSRDTGHKDYIVNPRAMETLNIWEKSDEARSIILSTEFAALAAKLLGVSAVRIYHDAALYKMPGVRGTGWHQDNRYMIFNKTVTLWLALSDIPSSIGSLSFVSGSHRLGDFHAEEMRLLIKAERVGLSSIINYGAMNAGDATFHSGWTIHSSAANTTQSAREVLVIIYYPENEPLLNISEYQTRLANKERWCPGTRIADSDRLHPVLYHKLD